MKFNKTLLIIFMVLISLFAVGAVSASDSNNMTDVMQVAADDNEMELIDVDEKLNANEALSVGEGNSSDVDMNLIVKNTSYDERVIINVTVVDNTGTINYTESGVEIYVDGKFVVGKAPINPTTGQSGVGLALGELEVGRHYVETTLVNGTNKILTKDAVFYVTKATPIVDAQDVIVDLYQNVTIPINVTDKNGNKLSGDAIVTITWSGDTLSKRVQVVDGIANANFDFTNIIGIMSSMGMEEMMNAMMGGDSGGMNWEEMFGGNGTFDWTKMMEMNWTDMFNGSGGMNWEEMFGGNGTGMESMMTVTFDYIFTPGNYNVTTTFLSNRNYETANTTSNLLIAYLEDVVYLADFALPKSLGNDTVITITVLDKYSRPIPNIVVTAILDGKQSNDATLNENGTAKITFKNLVNGNHELVLKSNVNGTSTNKTFDFVVAVNKVNVTIDAKDLKANVKISKEFTATIKDALGNVVSNKAVQISINNKKYNVKTGKDGVAKLPINIAKAGTYTCTVVLLSDDTYNGDFKTAKVTVSKQSAKLTVAKKTYKKNAKTKKFTATLKSSNGKAIKNKKVTFKVNGKTYSAKTNSKGVATIKVKLNKKGNFKVTAKFAGDSTYKAVSKVGKLVLK